MKLNAFNRYSIKNKKFNIEDFILTESLLDVRKKNANNLSDDKFKFILSFDPKLSELDNLSDEELSKHKENYVRWLLKMYNKNELKNDNKNEIKTSLKLFDELKKRRTVLPNNDINSYKSIEELKTAVDNIKNNLTINQKNKDAKRNQKQLQGEKQPGLYMNGAVELLFNGNDWEVWTPHTYEGSKALRRGASWCTGGDNDHYYKDYVSDGTLYVIIDKHNPKNKLQLFLPFPRQGKSKEFRNADNEGMSFRKFVHENEELLNFFKDVEDIEYSFEDLENPDINDEFTEEQEMQVIIDYDLSYDYDTFEVCMDINYDDLIDETYYTDPKDYRDYACGEFEISNDSEKLDKLKRDIIQSEYFVRYNEWKHTQLYTLYNFYLKDTNTNKNDLDFQSFLYVLFKTGGYEYPNSPVSKWFDNRHSYWYIKVLNSITETVAHQLIQDFLYDSLTSLGWNPPKSWNYNTQLSSNMIKNYYKKFEEKFIYKFDNCHTVEDFWCNYTNYGSKTRYDIISENDIVINESKGSIEPDDFDSDYYESNDMKNDASNILDIFMSIQEYNKFVEDEEDEEINESVFYDGELKSEFSHYYGKIYKNPSRKQLLSMLEKGDVRGYYNEIEMEYYFWQAKSLNHYAFENNFGETGCGFILTKTHILFNEYYLNPEKFTKDEDLIYDAHNYVEMISTDKYITKLYPNGVKIGESY